MSLLPNLSDNFPGGQETYITEDTQLKNWKAKQLNTEKTSRNRLTIGLEWAKQEGEISRETIFIGKCTIHPDLFVVLGNGRQLQGLGQFCTNPVEFCIFKVDQTFNIFHRNISLMVTTYRNLKQENKQTSKPPVFIGPLLMHQSKDVLQVCPAYYI